VPNVHDVAAASGSPAADRVPAGTEAEYDVALGKPPAGSKSSVRVPTQRHCPGGWGSRRTGTCAAAASWVSSAIIGWSNVTLRCGATGTSPSGA
jgi:hypothetical protein